MHEQIHSSSYFPPEQSITVTSRSMAANESPQRQYNKGDYTSQWARFPATIRRCGPHASRQVILYVMTSTPIRGVDDGPSTIGHIFLLLQFTALDVVRCTCSWTWCWNKPISSDDDKLTQSVISKPLIGKFQEDFLSDVNMVRLLVTLTCQVCKPWGNLRPNQAHGYQVNLYTRTLFY